MELLGNKEKLMKIRQPLMDITWERDADDIYNAFQKFSTDKSTLVKIIPARAYWQIALISEAFEKKYGMPLLEKVVNELTTLLGSLLTGSGTGLSKLLTYRILPQHERDAALIRDFSDGMSIDDANLLEIICTRTNAQLSAAMEHFAATYKRNLPDVIKNKCSYKNYRDFVLRILECEHDESNTKLSTSEAKYFADELYAAGAARSIGIDPEPFIRILGSISNVQFEQINEQYPKQQLIKDITAKTGGDFQLVILTRVADKFEYLAGRIDAALKGFSPDTESVCRILGSLSRPHCVKVRDAYNRLGFKRTLEEALKTVLKSQANYLMACQILISDDMSLTPLGSDKEIEDEEVEVGREADRQVQAIAVTYNRQKTIERGEAEAAAAKASKRKQSAEDEGVPGSRLSSSDIVVTLTDEERIMGFAWDGKGRFMDAAKLTATFRELEYVENQATNMLDRLGDEIGAIRDMYGTILKSRFETEAYIRIYGQHCKCLKEFVDSRNKSGLHGATATVSVKRK